MNVNKMAQNFHYEYASKVQEFLQIVGDLSTLHDRADSLSISALPEKDADNNDVLYNNDVTAKELKDAVSQGKTLIADVKTQLSDLNKIIVKVGF